MIVTYSEKLSIRFLLEPTKSDSFLRKDVSRPKKEEEEETRKATSLFTDRLATSKINLYQIFCHY